MASTSSNVFVSLRADDAADDSETMTAKGIAMGTLFAASVLVGLIPFALSHWLKWDRPTKNSEVFISLLLAFGGGVLLATTFLHLLPEVRLELERAGVEISSDFPLAELLMCVGFFAIYFVSECVHTYIERYNNNHNNNKMEIIERDVDEAFQQQSKQQQEGESDTIQMDGRLTVQQPPQHHSHLHLPENDGKSTDLVVNSLRGLLIVLALSVHELFEGMAMGLENSPAHVWLFFGAIASHKFVLAFCVGVELIVAKTNTKLAVCYVLIFSVVSSIGIGVGMAISSSTGAILAGGVLQAIATGTLVFVVFFEILKKSGSGLLQFVAVLVGFFGMFGLQRISKCDLNLPRAYQSEDSLPTHNYRLDCAV